MASVINGTAHSSDLDRFGAMCRCIALIGKGQMRTRDGEGRETTVEIKARFVRKVAAFGAALSDAELLAAYQRTGVEPDDPEADALFAEIERRRLKL